MSKPTKKAVKPATLNTEPAPSNPMQCFTLEVPLKAFRQMGDAAREADMTLEQWALKTLVVSLERSNDNLTAKMKRLREKDPHYFSSFMPPMNEMMKMMEALPETDKTPVVKAAKKRGAVGG